MGRGIQLPSIPRPPAQHTKGHTMYLLFIILECSVSHFSTYVHYPMDQQINGPTDGQSLLQSCMSATKIDMLERGFVPNDCQSRKTWSPVDVVCVTLVNPRLKLMVISPIITPKTTWILNVPATQILPYFHNLAKQRWFWNWQQTECLSKYDVTRMRFWYRMY